MVATDTRMRATTHGPLFRVCQKNCKLIHQPAQRETRRYGRRRLEKKSKGMIYGRDDAAHCRHSWPCGNYARSGPFNGTLQEIAKELMVYTFLRHLRIALGCRTHYLSGVAANGAFQRSEFGRGIFYWSWCCKFTKQRRCHTCDGNHKCECNSAGARN